MVSRVRLGAEYVCRPHKVSEGAGACVLAISTHYLVSPLRQLAPHNVSDDAGSSPRRGRGVAERVRSFEYEL